MVDFKLCIANPKDAKTFQMEVKDADAEHFMGKNIGEKVSGEIIGATGYEFLITGGSDNCGFPMRRGILGTRKQINLLGGVGLRKNLSKGVRKRKTVCGHKINERISQINLKVTKEGAKKLDQVLGGEGAAEEKPAEAPKEEKKEAPKEAPKAEEKPKEEKKEAPKAEDKPKEAKEEKPKAQAKEEKKE